MVYFCMNFIISFITEAHETANEKVKQRSDWTEYFHYLGKSPKKFKNFELNIDICRIFLIESSLDRFNGSAINSFITCLSLMNFSCKILGNWTIQTYKREEIRKV